jgi:hypothetical protein
VDREHFSGVGGIASDRNANASGRTAWRPVLMCIAICGLAVGCTAAPSAQPSPSVSVVAPTDPATPTATVQASATMGTTAEVVPSATMTTAAPIGLDESSSKGVVKVSLTKLADLKAEAMGPGEIAGPAVAVTVKIRNGGDQALDLDHVIVNLLDANGELATPMTGDPAAPLQGQLAAGASQSGVYVFSVAKAQRKPVQISVTYDVKEPTVLFKGNL